MPWSLKDKVESLECREPVVVHVDESLRQLAHALWVENIGALVVRDAHRDVGIVSERDLISQVAHGADLDTVTAGEVMSKHLAAVKAGDTLGDAAYQMLERGIRHLPVTDDEDHVTGMVSLRDLLRPALSGGSVGLET